MSRLLQSPFHSSRVTMPCRFETPFTRRERRIAVDVMREALQLAVSRKPALAKRISIDVDPLSML